MDRSFLSQTNVIEASRAFVCVRLATYEDKTESLFLKNFTRTGSGELENSVFGILTPDGKQKLVRSGRSPSHVFDGPSAMADTMRDLAKKYPGDPRTPLQALPLVANIKLGVNVAAADHQPLVVVIAATAEERQRIEAKLAPLAWSREFVGTFVYASGHHDDAKMLEGKLPKTGLVVVRPEPFGRTGAILATWDATQPDSALVKSLQIGRAEYSSTAKSVANHVREGQRQGVFWEPPVPVSDPMEQKARERGKLLNPKR